MTDEELIAKADRWINNSCYQNWKTDHRAIGFIANLLLQDRQGHVLSEKQKDYMHAVIVRCYDESQT